MWVWRGLYSFWPHLSHTSLTHSLHRLSLQSLGLGCAPFPRAQGYTFLLTSVLLLWAWLASTSWLLTTNCPFLSEAVLDGLMRWAPALPVIQSYSSMFPILRWGIVCFFACQLQQCSALWTQGCGPAVFASWPPALHPWAQSNHSVSTIEWMNMVYTCPLVTVSPEGDWFL
jgi:hypothetical protein